jgi:hypothetical protein
MLNNKNLSLTTAIAASITLGTLLMGGVREAQASTLKALGTIDLKTGDISGSFDSDIISFVQQPVDVLSPYSQAPDGYYETVLKLTLDPANNPYYETVIFDVEYDGNPLGISVNIGDSATNNGHDGDAGTQSNDAEMQIGVSPSAFPMNHPEQNDLSIYGNDYHIPQQNDYRLFSKPDLVSNGTKIALTVGNEYLGWDNGSQTGHLSSPYLYALDGQPDDEGPVNYDIYAAFNRSISSSRPGSGVSKVTIYVSTPEPAATVGLFSMAILGGGSLLKRKQNQKG